MSAHEIQRRLGEIFKHRGNTPEKVAEFVYKQFKEASDLIEVSMALEDGDEKEMLELQVFATLDMLQDEPRITPLGKAAILTKLVGLSFNPRRVCTVTPECANVSLCQHDEELLQVKHDQIAKALKHFESPDHQADPNPIWPTRTGERLVLLFLDLIEYRLFQRTGNAEYEADLAKEGFLYNAKPTMRDLFEDSLKPRHFIKQ